MKTAASQNDKRNEERSFRQICTVRKNHKQLHLCSAKNTKETITERAHLLRALFHSREIPFPCQDKAQAFGESLLGSVIPITD
jgi:hypothetical protein